MSRLFLWASIPVFLLTAGPGKAALITYGLTAPIKMTVPRNHQLVVESVKPCQAWMILWGRIQDEETRIQQEKFKHEWMKIHLDAFKVKLGLQP